MGDRQTQDGTVVHGGAAERSGAGHGRVGHEPASYGRSQPVWSELLGNMATDLIRVFRPRRVFDAGCALGFLVEAFWDRGVEAWGRDISAYAIGNIRADVRQYCAEGSIVDPIEGHFDLVTCIEVVEHMAEGDAIAAIANMTSVTDRIVFSSSPIDLERPTHVNVKPIIYWLRRFADRSFGPVGVDLPWILPHAVAFERRAIPPTQEELLATAEIIRMRIQAGERASDLQALRGRQERLQAKVNSKDAALQDLQAQPPAGDARGRQGPDGPSRVRSPDPAARASSAKDSSILSHLNARATALIRAGLESAAQVADLAQRCALAEAELARSKALVDLYQRFLLGFAAEHSDALTTVEATSRALEEGASAYAAAIGRLQSAEQRLTAFEQAIGALRSSTSWRATALFRKLRGATDAALPQGWAGGLDALPAFPSPLPRPSSAADQDGVPADFDAAWYAEQYPDVKAAGLSPAEHYRRFGREEGRSHRAPPTQDGAAAAVFDRDWYLATHADVAAEGTDPLQHFLTYGRLEDRSGSAAADPAEAGVSEGERRRAEAEKRIWAASGFDRDWYVANNEDVASDPDPSTHYLVFGLREGRPGSRVDVEAGAFRSEAFASDKGLADEPAALFAADGSRLAPELDRDWYLAANKDVRDSGGNPELHYVLYGKAEGRAPNAVMAEHRKVFRLQTLCNPHEAEDFIPESDPGFFVSILTPAYNTEPRFLRELYRSIANQRYGRWEWVVVDDGSTTPGTLTTLRDLAGADERVRLVVAPRNTGIAGASNAALAAARGTHCALVDHDDLLARDALLHIHREWSEHEDAQLFYTDECKLLPDGWLDQFWAKPVWSPAYIENTMYVGHLSVYETRFLRDLGGFRSEYDGTQDFDLVLRAALRRPKVRHVPVFAYLWRIIPGSSALDLHEKPYAVDRQRRAVLDYARHICPDATVVAGWGAGYWRIRYPLATPAPLLSYVIPTGAGRRVVRGESLDLITNCIRSFDAKAFYPNREYVVVHNGDLSDEQLAALRGVPRIKLVHYDAPSFNFSEKLNLGVAHASGEYLCLVNDDVEAITPYGGEEMVSYLAFNPGVGCIGPLCLREDDTIQQNGVVFVPDVGPAHAGGGRRRNFGGHVHRLNCRRESVVIGGAMMVIRKSVFDRHGGYDVRLPLNYNDVDFGLRLAESGLTNVIDPGIEVYHFESSTQVGAANVEQETLFAWGRNLDDPYFSRWFDTSNADLQLDLRRGVSGPVHFGPWLDRRIRHRAATMTSSGRIRFTVAVSVLDQPRAFLRQVYRAFRLQTYANAELVILDRGSTDPETVDWLGEVEREGVARLIRGGRQPGTAGAYRALLEAATGDVFVPVDAQDFVSVDALQVMAHHIEKHPSGKVFYSDSYASNPGSERLAPYFKPDFDPVLIMNCCYPEHMIAVDVAFLRRIDAYADDAAGECPAWDAVARAMAAGEEPIHVPEPLYARRAVPGSASGTGEAPGAAASEKAVLDRLLKQRGLAPMLRVEPNAAGPASGAWRLATDEPVADVAVLDAASVWGEGGSGLAGLGAALGSGRPAWVAVLSDAADPRGLLALSAVARLDVRVRVVSGLVLDGASQTLKWSGGLFTPSGTIVDPYAGQPLSEGGYHGQLWCQRCVDVAAPVNVLVRAESLREALGTLRPDAGADDLMTALGVLARSSGGFVAVTPHVLWADDSRDLWPMPMDRRGEWVGDARFGQGRRWYPPCLSLDHPYTLPPPRPSGLP